MRREDFYIAKAKEYTKSETIADQEALAFIAGMATADKVWYDMEKRLPIPTDGDDFLVKMESGEDKYAYAWYAYDRQCFMCYATGLSLGIGVRFYKPIIAPQER